MEPQHEERRLISIISSDVVGYSRLMAADESGTYAQLKAHRKELLDPKTEEYHGRTVKLTGDGALIEFGSVIDALNYSIDVQRAMAERNAMVPEDRRIIYRVGINLGDVIIDGDDIFGNGVNVAARLEQLAPPGGICISQIVYDQVKNKVDLEFEDMGEKQVKNIPDPVRMYQVDLSLTNTNSKSRGSDVASPPLPDEPSIAVLPFENMSGDPEQEYFSDGITEDIITALSKLRWFLVIARNSTFVYKGKSVDIKQVVRELGVQYILEGSVRKSGNRLRITAQLIDGTNGNHLWAEKYDRELADIFDIQDEITQTVVAAIEPKLVAAEGIRSHRRSDNDLNAWDIVMRAMSHYGRMSSNESRTAVKLLEEAVEKYPNYGPAHSLLSFVLLVAGHIGWIPESDEYRYSMKLVHRATELANRAAELDDEDPWAHLALGYLSFVICQTDEAVREYKRALELNPNFAAAYGYLGWALVFDDQSDEARSYFQQALRMSPHDPLTAFFHSGTCTAYYFARDYEKGIEWGRSAIRERSGFTAAHRILCASLAQAGKTEETRKAMERLLELQPNISIAWIEEHVPYTPRAMPHFLDGMRKAGVPES